MHHKKRLGQHFITDQNIINKLVASISPSKNDFILEIGPGDGAMTKYLISKAKKMLLIEKDVDLLKDLNTIIDKYPSSIIINDDILKYDLNQIVGQIRVVGNLPYNISTEIIFKMCSYNKIIDIHFMLQKEVIDRIVAKENTKDYGRLSIMTQAYFEVKKLFNISEHVFHPKPKVKSAFIQLKPKMYLFDSKTHEKVFFEIVKNAFSGRRKMIKRSLSKYLTQNDFDDLNINPESRAENLSVNDYISISRYVKKI